MLAIRLDSAGERRGRNMRLTGGGVKHDANRVTERLGGKVLPELSANHSTVTVRAGDLAPDDADLGAVDGALGGVNVGDALWWGGRVGG